MHAGTSVTTPGGFLTAAVIVDGEEQPLWRRADGYLYVAGVPGKEYALRVTLGHGRGEVIIGIDGRHIREDEPADFERNEGLIVTGSYAFKGYIISDTEFRAFTFADPGLSVSARATGSTGNTGVIGIAAYPEKESWVYASATVSPGGGWRGGGSVGTRMAKGASGASGATMDSYSPDRGDESVAVAGLGMAASGPTLGTAMGASGSHSLGRTSFTRRPGAPETLVIGYQTERQLRAWGLVTPADPDPWPGKGQTGYAKW